MQTHRCHQVILPIYGPETHLVARRDMVPASKAPTRHMAEHIHQHMEVRRPVLMVVREVRRLVQASTVEHSNTLPRMTGAVVRRKVFLVLFWAVLLVARWGLNSAHTVSNSKDIHRSNKVMVVILPSKVMEATHLKATHLKEAMEAILHNRHRPRSLEWDSVELLPSVSAEVFSVDWLLKSLLVMNVTKAMTKATTRVTSKGTIKVMIRDTIKEMMEVTTEEEMTLEAVTSKSPECEVVSRALRMWAGMVVAMVATTELGVLLCCTVLH